MSHTGEPLSANTCWFAAAALSSARSAEVVTVESSCGGVCNSAPRCGVAALGADGIPPLPPHDTTTTNGSSAKSLFPSRRMVVDPWYTPRFLQTPIRQ
jgi:hypothetical protein